MNIQKWFDTKGAQLGEAIILQRFGNGNGKFQAGGYIITLRSEDGTGSIAIEKPRHPYYFEFSFVKAEGAIKPIDIIRFDRQTVIEECIFQSESVFYFRLGEVRDNLQFLYFWTTPKGELEVLSVDDLISGHFAHYSQPDWKGQGNYQKKPSELLSLPDDINGLNEISGLKIPWHLPNVEKKVEEVIESFNIKAFAKAITCNQIISIPDE